MTEDSLFPTPAVSIRRCETPLTASVDGELVMLDAEQGEYFALGDVGSRIWELLEEPHTLAEVCSVLQDEYTVEPETCRKEVAKFVRDLYEAELVEVAA